MAPSEQGMLKKYLYNDNITSYSMSMMMIMMMMMITLHYEIVTYSEISLHSDIYFILNFKSMNPFLFHCETV